MTERQEDRQTDTDQHVAHLPPDAEAGAAVFAVTDSGLFGDASIARLAAGTPIAPLSPSVHLTNRGGGELDISEVP